MNSCLRRCPRAVAVSAPVPADADNEAVDEASEQLELRRMRLCVDESDKALAR